MTHRTFVRTASGLGAYAAEQRELRGLTQSQLAQRAGVSREWVGRFERGENAPSLVSVMRVLKVLNVRIYAETDEPQGGEE